MELAVLRGARPTLVITILNKKVCRLVYKLLRM
jgi:hypothetical protein